LDAALERNAAILGDAEQVSEGAGEAETPAFEELLSTPPTSMAGLRALLVYLSDDVADLGQRFDARNAEMLIYSIHDALLELNPSDATGGQG